MWYASGLMSEGGNDQLKSVLVITGPTASGKSKLSMDLAARIPLEIISADSMQVYRHMDIGTDKASAEERSLVRHHLIDVKDPDEAWSVEEFKSRAAAAIDDIAARKHLPCIVGGTGLYVRALTKDYPLVDAPPDGRFRDEMRSLAKERGNQAVHALLWEKDPDSWNRLHPNDLKRVIRALEYYEATGQPISARRGVEATSPYRCLTVGIERDRQELQNRIDNRVEVQFARGFVGEVQDLLALGYREDLPSMQGLGYKEICQHLRGLSTIPETMALIKRNTRRFAKRQLTWFSREEGINWVRAGNDTPWDETVKRALDLAKERFALD